MSIGRHVGIVDAARLSVEDAVQPTPTMREAILGWFRPLALARVTKKTVDFETKEFEEPLATSGVIQPLSATKIALKPEGLRSWVWLSIHATPDLVLFPDDVIVVKGVRYRVEGKWDWSQFGYVNYEVVQAYGRT